MEPWSARDDNPYVRRAESPAPAWMLIALVILAIAAAGYYFWWQNQTEQSQEPPPFRTAEPLGEPAPQAGAAAPARVFDATPVPGLPTLENSDAMMRDTVVGLVGRKSFEEWVYPKDLIRRIVATVDNLPRETAPRRVMPLEPVPGAFTIGAANSARYAPYVRVFDSLEARAVVQRYAESYPLFQRAYAELGFPNQSFNERLVEAIDDLLAAPELAAPLELARPKVLYQFADPDLEGRSAGQKIMLRMGSENSAKVKAKLREIRRELTRR